MRAHCSTDLAAEGASAALSERPCPDWIEALHLRGPRHLRPIGSQVSGTAALGHFRCNRGYRVLHDSWTSFADVALTFPQRGERAGWGGLPYDRLFTCAKLDRLRSARRKTSGAQPARSRAGRSLAESTPVGSSLDLATAHRLKVFGELHGRDLRTISIASKAAPDRSAAQSLACSITASLSVGRTLNTTSLRIWTVPICASGGLVT
jgi:hypothetical protein